MTIKTNIPPSWSIANLCDVINPISTNNKKLKQKEYIESGKYPVIDQGHDFIGGYSDDEKLLLDFEPPVVVFGDHTKVKKFVNFRFIVGADGVKVLKPFNCFDPKLFFYFLHCIKFVDKGYARHYQHLVKESIPIPPLKEQHRIVSKLEELFSQLDTAVATLKKAKEQIKTYKQSVLYAAFSGRLGMQNVECKMQNDTRLPEGWKRVKLGKIIEDIRYGTSKKCTYENTGLPVLRIPNVINGNIDISDLKYADFSKEEIKQYSLKSNDVLIIRSNGSISIVGKTAVVTKKLENYIYAGYLIRMRFNHNFSNSQFFNYQFQSIQLRNQIELKAKSTSGVNNINANEIQDLDVALPPISEQEQIVSEIETRFSEAENLEKTIDLSLKQAESLRQSILKKAFEGGLVPQDPNDEPAEKLLERIKKEKEIENKGMKLNRKGTKR